LAGVPAAYLLVAVVGNRVKKDGSVVGGQWGVLWPWWGVLERRGGGWRGVLGLREGSLLPVRCAAGWGREGRRKQTDGRAFEDEAGGKEGKGAGVGGGGGGEGKGAVEGGGGAEGKEAGEEREGAAFASLRLSIPDPDNARSWYQAGTCTARSATPPPALIPRSPDPDDGDDKSDAVSGRVSAEYSR